MREFYLPSTDKKHQLHVTVWEPEVTIRGIVQISHGMVEYVQRFAGLAEYLNGQGFVVLGNDHLGHGLSAGGDEDLGYFCPDNMSATVVNDLHEVTKYAKQTWPNVPLYLFGHSMGSFMARRYIMTYGQEINGVIISGTGSQPGTVLKAGNVVAGLIKTFRGDRYRSQMLKKMSFSKYLDLIPNPRTANDWLTKDNAIVDKYNADKYCTYSFTVNGYRTLFDVLTFIQTPANVQKIPKNLPVLFISGTEDPVGLYGKAVTEIYENYKQTGITDISIKLYEGDRHELTNELDKETVFADITGWITQRM